MRACGWGWKKRRPPRACLPACCANRFVGWALGCLRTYDNITPLPFPCGEDQVFFVTGFLAGAFFEAAARLLTEL